MTLRELLDAAGIPAPPDGDDVPITGLASDPELSARLGESGRREMFERYSVSRLVDDVDRLYRALLAAKGLAGLRSDP